jgi:iron complex transport system ATP-binding protein
MSHHDLIIEVDHLTYRRNDKSILNDISFQMNSGDNCVIFGPNGSGKTTLLRCLTGYIFPSEGRAQVLGETLGETDVFALRRRIAWVSSSLEEFFHNEDPAYDIILAGPTAATRLWFDPTEADEKKAKEIIAKLAIQSFMDTAYGDLSQGERKKVMIARGLMTNPQLLILDEPCEGLDIAAREIFLRDLAQIVQFQSKPSILLVTHRVEEITNLFTKMLLLKHGKKITEGTPNDLMTSSVMSSLFGIPITIEKRNGRYQSSLA